MNLIHVRNLNRRTLTALRWPAPTALLALLACGPLSTRALASATGIHPSHAVRALTQLAALGIVRRHTANGMRGEEQGLTRTWSVRTHDNGAEAAQQVAA